MYQFQLISDIHLEFGAIKKISKCADYLILAGDIGYPDQKLFKDFLSNTSKIFNKVFYVAGNHEYYQNWKKGKNIRLDTKMSGSVFHLKHLFKQKDALFVHFR